MLDSLLSEAASRFQSLAAQASHDPAEIEADWRAWLAGVFGPSAAQIAPHHGQLWRWVWGIQPGIRPAPFVAIWPRGGLKSTSAEQATVAVAARGIRRYGLYISGTQDQAADHLQTIQGMLEAERVASYYPMLGARLEGKYRTSKGWRSNRLRTATGFSLDAVGLDTAIRGAKLDDARPDWIVLDDIDDALDGPAAVKKKIQLITRSILPAGAPDTAILAVQNLVHPDGVFAQLADGRADFLAGRILSGPVPALQHAAYEQRDGRWIVVAGTPTWQGQDLAVCQQQIGAWGYSSFRTEAQHEVEAPPGGMFSHLTYRHADWDELPDFVRIVVWVDPAVTDKDQSDSHGIQADGITSDGTIYRLWSWENRTSPEDVLRRAIRKAVELGAEAVGVETDQGGDVWVPAYREAVRALRDAGELPTDMPAPVFRAAKAGAGHGPKVHRAAQMLADYERGKLVHVLGTHATLERALHRFPRTKPLDLVDSAYWAWADLTGRLDTDEAPPTSTLVVGGGGGRMR